MMDIENEAELTEYLRRTGRVGLSDEIKMRVLRGGVSNRTVWVQPSEGPAWVIKQALQKLRVDVDWFSSPERIAREALGMRWLSELTPPGSIPRFLFEDSQFHLVAMEAVPSPHSNWKQVLLNGHLVLDHVEQFGRLLGTIHRRAASQSGRLRADFEDRQYFESLRLEPYYKYTSQVVPQATSFLRELIEQTWSTRITLVHGDYSPKNILVHQQRLMLIDHEVIHFGDPAFDLGFSMAHLLSKAHFLASHRHRFCESAVVYWQAYLQSVESLIGLDELESRAVRHTIACLLARARGRSPLEYLDASARTRQERYAVQMINANPSSFVELAEQWRIACEHDAI